MANSYSCPSCGAPLDYHGVMTTVQCPYCFTSSSVPEDLRSEAGNTVEPGVMLNYMAAATTLRELAAAVKAHQTDQAIALYQKAHRVSAEAAAQAVAQLTGGGTVLVNGAALSATAAPGSSPSPSVTPAPPSTYGSPLAPLDPAFPASPSYTVPSSYSQPSYPAQPQVTTYPPVSPSASPARSRSPVGVIVFAGVGVVMCAVVGALAFLLVSFGSPDSSTVDATQALVETRIANASTEQSQSSATEAVIVPIEPATEVPPPTDDPSVALTVTALSQADAAADAALLAEAKSWPISFQDDFSKDTGAWVTGPEDNDYYSGTHTLADGLFTWDLTAKDSFVSFISPDPYKSVTDFYAAVDVTIHGSDSSGGGLAFRDGANSDSGYYIYTVSPDGYYAMDGYQGSTNISHNGTIEPAPTGTNRLAVVGQGSHFLLLLNDEVIDSLDDPFFKAGDVGVAVSMNGEGDQATFDFDNFEIRTPPQ